MRPGEAIMQLTRHGYEVTMTADTIKFTYKRPSAPDRDQVAPLFEIVKKQKEEAISFLRVHCPKCGGCMTWRDLWGNEKCINCDPPDWQLLERIFPQVQGVKH